MHFLKVYVFIVPILIIVSPICAYADNNLVVDSLHYIIQKGNINRLNLEGKNDPVPTSCLPGIISYWKFDETKQGYYSDFVGPNSITCKVSPTPIPGKINGAQLFNGTTTKIDISADESFDFKAKKSFSVEFWYKGLKLPSSAKCAVGRYIRENNSKWFVGLNANDGKAKFYMSSGGRSATVNGSQIVDGNWHYVAATRNGISGVISIYVDGLFCSSSYISPSVSFTSPTAAMNIGWLNLQEIYSLNGCLDEIAIYNIELPLSEIQKHFYNGLAGLSYCNDSKSQTAPFIISIPVEQATAGKLYSYHVEATGNPAPTFKLVEYPQGMTIDSVSGVIKWIPQLACKHSILVKIEAHNGTTPNFTQTFFISVIGTISYWSFDETIPGYYNDWILDCNAIGIVPPLPIAGQVKGAQYFDGNTKVDVKNNLNFFDFDAYEDFSIEFWYKGSTIPSTVKSAIGRYDSKTGARWFVGINANNGKAKFYMTSGGTSAEVNGTIIVDNRWHHIAATRNGTTGSMKIYVDGLLRGSTSHAFTIDFSSPSANLNIGWLSFQNEYSLEGILDEIAIYNIELSSPEIKKHYNNSSSGLDYFDIKEELVKDNTDIQDILEYKLPEDYQLYQNYPNPFNSNTKIKFVLPVQQNVNIRIYNQLGQEVIELVNQYFNAGSYEIEFDASSYGLSSGIYLYRMQSGEFLNTKKFILLK